MSIYKTSDQLARCDSQTYSNFYDASKKNIKLQPLDSVNSSKDTLEIACEKLKQDALKQLRHHSKYTIAQTSFIRIGKYLFIALAFPPYLLIYGLPKWIVMQGIPAITSLMFTFFNKIKQKGLKQVEIIKEKMNQILLRIQQDLQKLIAPIVRLGFEIKQAFQRMRLKTLTTIKQWNEKLKKIIPKSRFKHFKEKLKQMFNDPYVQFIKGKEIIKNWKLQIVQFSDSLRLSISRLKNFSFRAVNKQLSPFKERWKSSYAIARSFAQKGVNGLDQGISFIFQKISQWGDPIKRNYHQWIKPIWDKINAFYFAKKEKLQAWHQKFLLNIYHRQERLKNLTFEQIVGFISSQIKFKIWPDFLQRLCQRFSQNKWIRLIVKQLFKGISFAISTALKGIVFLFRMISTILEYFSKGIDFIFNIMTKICQFILQYVWLSLLLTKKYLFKLVYVCLLLLMMMSILVVWGIQLLGEQMSLLMRILPSFNRSNTSVG